MTRPGVQPHWFASGDRFWYRIDLKDGEREYFVVDATKGERRPAFDSSALAEALSKSTGETHKADRLRIDLKGIEDNGALRFEFLGKHWRFESEGGILDESKPFEPKPESSRQDRQRRFRSGSSRGEESPDGQWTALIKDHNLFLRCKSDGKVFPVTFEGNEGDGYEPGVFWSPDSTHCVALRKAKGTSTRSLRRVVAPAQVQPMLQSHDYLKPGDRSRSRSRTCSTSPDEEVPVADDLFTESLEPRRGPLGRPTPRGSPSSTISAGIRSLRLVAVDAETGEAKADRSTSGARRSSTIRSKILPSRLLDATGEILWMSERDGWNHST